MILTIGSAFASERVLFHSQLASLHSLPYFLSTQVFIALQCRAWEAVWCRREITLIPHWILPFSLQLWNGLKTGGIEWPLMAYVKDQQFAFLGHFPQPPSKAVTPFLKRGVEGAAAAFTIGDSLVDHFKSGDLGPLTSLPFFPSCWLLIVCGLLSEVPSFHGI